MIFSNPFFSALRVFYAEMQTRTLRLAVLSYLVFVLYLWVARLLGLTGVVLPLSSTATGSQADSMTAVLLLMGFVGIVGLRIAHKKTKTQGGRPLSPVST
jgi:uncharacterized membrane protein